MIYDFVFYILDNINLIIEKYNYGMIFLLMLIESSFIPFPSEIIMIPAGYLISKGSLSMSLSLLSAVLGSVFGALINYYIARYFGRKFLVNYGSYFFINKNTLNNIISFFNKHGSISTFIGRLLPLIRQYISFPAGISKMCLRKFVLYTSLGSFIWVFILVLVGLFFGSNIEIAKEKLEIITIITLLLVILVGILYYNISKYIISKN